MAQLSELINPTTLSPALAFFILMYLMVISYFGIKLRSPLIVFMFALSLVVFVLVILVNLSFIWFWVSVLLSILCIALVGMVFYVS